MEQDPLWPHLPTLIRLGLALGIGLFIGLERERRGKEAGLRTFGLVAVIGALGGLLGEPYGVLSLTLVGILMVFLNLDALRVGTRVELTTSVALVVTGFAGLLCGQGHTFTPVAVGIVTAGLLAWKERLVGFTLGLTDEEVRAAILLALLAFVIYPVLPSAPLDPWGLIQPQSAWLTVILIAGIGFANYVLLKLYGNRGVELAGFLGGLVNSTVTVAELALRVRESSGMLTATAYRGIMFSTAAMVVRNAVLLGILARDVLIAAAVPLTLMLLATIGFAFLARHPHSKATDGSPALQLTSPFALRSALKFGLIFVALEVAGGMAQATLGQSGFYGISVVGGLVSSASAVASAATLAAHGTISPVVAGTGAVLASLASALVNLPLVARVSTSRLLTQQLAGSLLFTSIVGIIGAMVQSTLLAGLLSNH